MHPSKIGDNYGLTCTVCGEVLSGYGYWAEGGNKDCVHVFLPSGHGTWICTFCERETSVDPTRDN